MELAVLLPVVVLLLLAVVQVGLLARDRVRAVHTARAVARTVLVDPTDRVAAAALDEQGLGGRARVELDGPRTPGSLLTVTVRLRSTQVPIVGRAVSHIEHVESFVVVVEGPDGVEPPA